ncbi:MAG: NAD(P) transhydrogenase subunit alpha [Candidatus Dormibacteria bacterium]
MSDRASSAPADTAAGAPEGESPPPPTLVVGVLDETRGDERRVATSPAAIRTLVARGHRVLVQTGAGLAAGWPDPTFAEAGAEVRASAAEVIEAASVVPCVAAMGDAGSTFAALDSRHTLVGLVDPLGDPRGVERLGRRGATVFAVDLLPRITRAQPMDVLSSQATIAGYKAVLMAASLSPRLLPMLTYAAGTVPPARVLVLGAGVAGLQAIATARRLGATVSGYDVRAAVREQVESLGARFVDVEGIAAAAEDASGYATGSDEATLAAQQEALATEIGSSDVVITTALVPGQRAPILVSAAAIDRMKPGSVVVDIAAERGGNVEGTVAGRTVTVGNLVQLVGATNLPATVPQDASQMLGKNLANFILHATSAGAIDPASEDELLRGTLVAHGGRVVHERVLALLGGTTGTAS